jgi:serine/threonine-protein kinase
MSPEQCRGAGLVDHRSDIYALGCIAFELLAGRPPFLYDGAGELIVAHVSEPPPALSSLAPSAGPELDRLVARMLSKNPNDRPQTMKEVSALLRAALAGSAADATLGLARSPAAGPVAGTLGATRVLPGQLTTLSDTAASLAAPSTAPAGRRRWLPLAAGALVVAAAVGALLLRSGPPLERPVPGTAAAPEPRPAAAPAPAAAAAPEPAMVSIVVASTPAGAQVWVDGEPEARGVTPLTLTVDRSPARRTLRLTLMGYAERRLSVAADRADAVAVALVKLPTKPNPRRRPRRAPDPEEGYRKLD